MRILQFLPYIPYPPISGGRVRSLNLIKHLSKEHELELACFVKPGEERFLSTLSSMVHRVHPISRPGSPTPVQILALSLSMDPILVRFYSSPYAQNLLQEILLCSQFDVLHIETYYIFKNLPSDLKIPLVLAESNIEYLLMKQLADRVKSPLWKAVFCLDALKQRVQETRVWRQADRCIAVTSEDAKIISKVTNSPVCVVENGVDSTVKQVNYRKAKQIPAMLFVGNFLHRPNVDGILYFLKRIFPLILKRLPGAQLMIAGDSPPPEVLAFETVPRVRVLGLVNDLQPLFEDALISICPIRIGSGSRIKILEALSRGHPVVTTTVGCSGLRVEHGKHLLIADRPEEFAEAVCSLLASQELREFIGGQGRQLVMKEYPWETSTSTLVSCYRSVLGVG